MFPYTIIPNNNSLPKYASKPVTEPPDLACGHFLELWAGSVGVSQKIKIWNCLLLLFPKNAFLSKDALKPIAEPPDLSYGRLSEPGAGFEGGIQKSTT